MWSIPTSAVDGDCVVSSSADSFYKGGRKISVGDCALFKPPKELPPFIGIIRWLRFKGEHLHLCVNWLYRPAEVKLGKGILLDASPNEIFYSFHKDEIPAASLLHPCKVAFLPKDVELSQGTPSFVCRRVYDVAKERLWWLTDQNYIDESQEEVDKLLIRTRKEMPVTAQFGGPSPKPVSGPMVSSQSKLGSDSVQNSGTSFSSHNKRRKRDHGDQGSEPGKRERSSKTGDGDPVQLKTENSTKSDITKCEKYSSIRMGNFGSVLTNITDQGGLVNTEGVDNLLQLMQPDKSDRMSMDLTSRSILASVIAMTDKFDCLSRFVQLRGCSVFDEWLQDIHKGKIVDTNSSNELEEFLLVLLRALDKLPVNLHALQTCNIGRSVNHLRTQKNVDIQRKARGLVDKWKKHVEAEMKIIDSKSGSNGDNKNNTGGSSETVPKNSDAQISASKSTYIKPCQGDPGTKSASLSPGAMKSCALSQGSGKATEEKSISSSQSHNYSQSRSTAGSMRVNKISGRTTRHRKSSNGVPGPAVGGIQKGTGSNKTISLRRGSSSERASGLTCEKAVDVPTTETKNHHKLIVKIPNRGPSPVQSDSGGLCGNSRVSSPVLSDKPEPVDQNMKEKNDACQGNVASDVNTESWQSNDFKEMLTGSDEGDVSPVFDDTTKAAEVLKTACSSSGNELKSGTLKEASLNSINVLIDSCVNHSEGIGDDVGMNLLASVATGEISKSDLVSPTDSPQRNLLENSCTGSDFNSRSSAGDIVGLQPTTEQCLGASRKDDVSTNMKVREGKESDQLEEEKKAATITNMDEDEKRTLEVQSSRSSFDQSDNKTVVKYEFSNGVRYEQKQAVTIMKTNNAGCTDKEKMSSSGIGKDLLNEERGEPNVGKPDGTESLVSSTQSGGVVQDTTQIAETRQSACVGSAVTECTKEDVESKEAHNECSAEEISHKASPTLPLQEKEKQQKTLMGLKPTGKVNEEKGVDMKPKFDLNEGLDMEDGNFGETSNLASLENASAHTITVTAAAKGIFVPPEDLLRSRRELGWKGSAATSAFRPAEPRKCLEMPLGANSLPLPDVAGNKNERPAFDFDLNVADERIEESMSGTVPLSALKINNDFGRKEQPSSPHGRASGGFDLDLNRVGDANEMCHSQLTSSKYRQEPSLFPVKSTPLNGIPNREILKDFDLNNGPVHDDCSGAVSSNQHGMGSVQFQPPVGGIRMNSSELGNFSAWFHPGNSYSPIPVPSIFHDKGDKPFPIITNQRIVGPPSGCTPDIYRGSVLSSSPSLPFPSTLFQYPVFPLASTYPVGSANLSNVPTSYMDTSSGGRIPYPSINPQFVGSARSGSSHGQRPYMVGLPDVSSNGGEENSRKFGKQGLDLNAGPGGLSLERKDEILPVGSRQFMVAGSQAISEEQARMHQLVGGGFLKRKEPDGSWDPENFKYRQFPWQQNN